MHAISGADTEKYTCRLCSESRSIGKEQDTSMNRILLSRLFDASNIHTVLLNQVKKESLA